MKKTLLLKVDPKDPDVRKVRSAADLIRAGGLVAFPTETVYGLGADALNPKAVLAVFEVKKRPLDNPPIVHVSSRKDVKSLASEMPLDAEKLMKRFWPGPLTLIFKKSDAVPSVTVAGLNTVAVRMPRHRVALALISEAGCPVCAPSANLAGKPSPTSAGHVLDDLDGRIDAVLDAGPTTIGVESTVLDLTVNPPQVLRPGGLPFEALKKTLKTVELSPAAISDRLLIMKNARSPGIKYKHYAPDADVFVVEGELSAVVDKINDLVGLYKQRGKVGVLCSDETEPYYSSDVVKSLGSRSDLAGMARNLFRLLREFDAEDVDVILAESPPVEELGLAVVNRLRKASGYKIIKV